jgi:hypothetical protein
VHWIGGHRTRTHLVRPVARLEQLSYYPQLVARVLSLGMWKKLIYAGPPKIAKFQRGMVVDL